MTGPGQISEVHERPVCSGALAQRPRRRSVSKKARRDGKLLGRAQRRERAAEPFGSALFPAEYLVRNQAVSFNEGDHHQIKRLTPTSRALNDTVV
jgi:hypothetical protein